jgi:streptogramin lyase
MNWQRVTNTSAVSALTLLSACGGGAASMPAAGHPAAGSARVQSTIRITVPNASNATTAQLRKRYSVALNTAGITVAAYTSPRSANATSIAQGALDVSASSSSCSTASSERTCTFSLTLPAAGTDDFVVTSYDTAPVGGAIPITAHQLGIGIASAVTIANVANTVNFTIEGVVASAAILPLTPTFPALSNGSVNVDVQALDADGNTIVADNYADANGNPVSIALGMTGSASTLFSLAPTTISAPLPNGATLAYTASGLTSNEFNTGFSLALTATPSNGATAAHATLNVPATNTDFLGIANEAEPNGIVLGPDKNLWFTDGGPNNAIGTMTPSGTYLSEVSTPTTGSAPSGITVGPDENIWFTEAVGEKIGAIDPTTRTIIGEFPVPNTGSQVANPIGITTGPDGNLWFTECLTSKIASINPTTHTITAFSTPTTMSAPGAIVSGPDGALWFTEASGNAIGRATTSGAITEFPLPISDAGPHDIKLGPDGALWFTQVSAPDIGRITTAGVITEFAIPNTSGFTVTITTGSDGNLWSSSNGQLIRITPTGTPTVFSNPQSASSVISGMTQGPDGNIFYLMQSTTTPSQSAAIGRITL